MSPTPRLQLLWSADDFGHSDPINQGIALGHRQGLIRNASLLATGDGFEGALRLARAMPELSLGVHLAAVEQRAVLPAAQLPGLCTPDGALPAAFPAFLKGWITRRIRPETVRAEWGAQLGRVFDTGLRPMYLDSHQHLHVLPGLLEITLELARKFGIRAVRSPSDVVPGRASLARRLMLSGLFLLGSGARTRIRQAGLWSADGTLGIADAGRLTEDRIRALVRHCANRRGTLELVTHPGMSAPHGTPALAWGYDWTAELEAARSGRLGEWLADSGVTVVGYRDLLADN